MEIDSAELSSDAATMYSVLPEHDPRPALLPEDTSMLVGEKQQVNGIPELSS